MTEREKEREKAKRILLRAHIVCATFPCWGTTPNTIGTEALHKTLVRQSIALGARSHVCFPPKFQMKPFLKADGSIQPLDLRCQ